MYIYSPYLALFNYIFPYSDLFIIIYHSLPWFDHMSHINPKIGILLLRLHLWTIKQLIMEVFHLQLCDLDLTFKGNNSSKIFR